MIHCLRVFDLVSLTLQTYIFVYTYIIIVIIQGSYSQIQTKLLYKHTHTHTHICICWLLGLHSAMHSSETQLSHDKLCVRARVQNNKQAETPHQSSKQQNIWYLFFSVTDGEIICTPRSKRAAPGDRQSVLTSPSDAPMVRVRDDSEEREGERGRARERRGREHGSLNV